MLEEIIAKKIGVFGYGVEGQSIVNFLVLNGAKNIKVFDEKEISNKEKIDGVSYYYGSFENQNHEGIELAFRSPGVKFQKLRAVLPDGVKISSLTNLFFNLAKGKKIIVTGTKGKSTTANIIYKIFKDNKLDVYLGGNVGNSLLDFANELRDESYTIVELSSFQLQDFEGVTNYCVYLPILTDHLDYHKDFDEYLQAKKQAMKGMKEGDWVILPFDELSNKLIENKELRYFYYSVLEIKSGCYLDRMDCVCRDGMKTSTIKNIETLSKEYKIPIVNLLAAITLSYKLNLNINLKENLKGFNKPKYRIEKIDTFSDIEFFNDSASTNPISTIEALKLMTKPVAVIMGGSSKNLDYHDLAQVLKSNKAVRSVFLIGETADEIKKALSHISFEKKILKKNNLDEVFEDLILGEKNYKSVLFSPASASFDQYQNYKDRGEAFTKLVKKYF